MRRGGERERESLAGGRAFSAHWRGIFASQEAADDEEC